MSWGDKNAKKCKIDVKKSNVDFQTSNCEIIRVKRQRTEQGFENEIEDPASTNDLNFYEPSEKYILVVKATKPAKCSITLPSNSIQLRENKESTFTWTYKKRNLFRNF